MSWASAVGSSPTPSRAAGEAAPASAAPPLPLTRPPEQWWTGAATPPFQARRRAPRGAAQRGRPPSAPAAAAKPARQPGPQPPANKALSRRAGATRSCETPPSGDRRGWNPARWRGGHAAAHHQPQPRGLAAKAKCLQVGDVFLKVSRMGTALRAAAAPLSPLRFAARDFRARHRAHAPPHASPRRRFPCAGQRLRAKGHETTTRSCARRAARSLSPSTAFGRRSRRPPKLRSRRRRARRGRRGGATRPCAPARRQRGLRVGGESTKAAAEAQAAKAAAEASRGAEPASGASAADVGSGREAAPAAPKPPLPPPLPPPPQAARGRRRSRNRRCPSTAARPAPVPRSQVAQPGRRRRRWRRCRRETAAANANLAVGGRRRCEGRRQPACRQGRRQSRRHPQRDAPASSDSAM